MATNRNPVPRLDLALVAHEISEKLQSILDEYGCTLVLARERSHSAVQLQFDGENDFALTLMTAAKPGVYQYRAIGKQVALADDLPGWLDRASWDEWLAYRAEIGKPMTRRTQKAQLAMLHSLYMQGLYQSACINQSIRNGWVGLFPGKTSENVSRGQAATDAFVGLTHG